MVYRFGLLRIYAINCIPGQWPIGKNVRSWAASLPTAWEHLTFALLFPTMQEDSFFVLSLNSTATTITFEVHRHSSSPLTSYQPLPLRYSEEKTFLQLTVLRRCMQPISTKRNFAVRLCLSIQSGSGKLPCHGRRGFMSRNLRCSTQWSRPAAHIAQLRFQTLVDAPHSSVARAWSFFVDFAVVVPQMTVTIMS